MKNFKSISYVHLLVVSAVVSLCASMPVRAHGANASGESWATYEAAEGVFPIATNDMVTGIYFDINENIAVRKAIKSLRDDICKVTGATPQLAVDSELPRFPIIIGTVGQSRVIDSLVEKGVIEADSLSGRWESFVVRVVKCPLQGVEQALVIAGSDRRGTVFGIYELSRQIGVSPWYWWLDVPVKKTDALYIKPIHFYSGEPSVKYRGIFLNDEFPSMTAWAKTRFGGMNSDMYAHIYELLLRLRANCLWPAMWGSFKEYRPLVPIFKDDYGYFEGNCFNEDDPLNPSTADDYGIVIGTSHHEPMQRSQQEWIRHKEEYGNGHWSFLSNREGVERFFADGIRRAKPYDKIVTVGMRGEEDCPMEDAGSAEENFRLMQQIIDRQREIIEDVTGEPAQNTPQVWTLYSEVLDYYDQGLKIPDDVILMFCDDNFGDVRRLPSKDAPSHPGGYGMYYHVGYYGAPRASKWLNTTQIQHMWEQLSLTYSHGVDAMWMLNVGDLKPHEHAIDFFMEMAWNLSRFSESNLMDYTTEFCSGIFGKPYAADAAYILDTYNKYAAWIHPEMLDTDTYSIEEYEYAANSLLALEARAHRLEKSLPADMADTYFQLIGYPVQALANLYDMYYSIALSKNSTWFDVSQKKYWSDRAKDCFRRDSILSYEYNNVVASGKWLHMMDQVHIGYESWHAPERNKMPVVDAELKDFSLGGYVFKSRAGEVVMDAHHFFSMWPQDTDFTLIPNLGRWKGGLKMDDASGVIDYRFRLDMPLDSVCVTVIMKSTMPFVDGGHYIDLAIDNKQNVSVPINQDLNWEHKYDLMYPVGASRVISKTVKMPIASADTHVLSVRPHPAGIVLYKIIVNAGEEIPSRRLLLNESEFSLATDLTYCETD